MPEELGLPLREFLYTTDQIAYLLNLSEEQLMRAYLFYEGRSIGVCPRDMMVAIDISLDSDPKPEWRVAERHLKRWMKFKGWKVYERGYVK